jgi:histidine ammonia-lyase
VDTIPTSGKQEDHVSMGWTAVRKLREVAANVRTCLSVEILCAAQGIDLRSDIAPPSPAVAAAHRCVRDGGVPRMDTDREVAGQIAAVDALLPAICAAAAAGCGGLR